MPDKSPLSGSRSGASLIWRTVDAVSDAAWWLRHPSTRRCPKCKLTWEPRDMLAVNGGVCHDCAAGVATYVPLHIRAAGTGAVDAWHDPLPVFAERDFLLERLNSRSDWTWVGMSSDALVTTAITGAPVSATPSDWADYWRCENTFHRAPAHLAARMLPALLEFRSLVAAKYPEEWERPDWAVAPVICDACELGLENAHHDH